MSAGRPHRFMLAAGVAIASFVTLGAQAPAQITVERLGTLRNRVAVNVAVRSKARGRGPRHP